MCRVGSSACGLPFHVVQLPRSCYAAVGLSNAKDTLAMLNYQEAMTEKGCDDATGTRERGARRAHAAGRDRARQTYSTAPGRAPGCAESGAVLALQEQAGPARSDGCGDAGRRLRAV